MDPDHLFNILSPPSPPPPQPPLFSLPVPDQAANRGHGDIDLYSDYIGLFSDPSVDPFAIIQNVCDEPWAPREDNNTVLVRRSRKKSTDGVAAGRSDEARPIDVSSTKHGAAKMKEKAVAVDGRGSGVRVKRPREEPLEADAEVITKNPKMEVKVELSREDKERLEDYMSLQKTLEFFRVKVEEAVGVMKPKITSESGQSGNEAIQQLEMLARIAWKDNHFQILNTSEES